MSSPHIQTLLLIHSGAAVILKIVNNSIHRFYFCNTGGAVSFLSFICKLLLILPQHFLQMFIVSVFWCEVSGNSMRKRKYTKKIELAWCFFFFERNWVNAQFIIHSSYKYIQTNTISYFHCVVCIVFSLVELQWVLF